MAKLTPPENRILRYFLQRGVDTEQPRSSYIAELHEFDDCRYKLERLREAPDILTMSFACAHPLPDAAEPALRAEYDGTAALAIEPESGYQITLHVSAQVLRGLPEARRAAVLDRLAAVRLYAVGAHLRQLLQALAAGELADTQPQALLARPGAPLFVRAEREALTVLLPMRQNEGREGALAAAFVKARPHLARCLGEFAGASRAASCGDAPRCMYTHPGALPPVAPRSPAETTAAAAMHAPPFPLEGAASEACDCSGGCLAFAVEARHVAAPERVDAVAWALLTLHAHIDMHVKRFKGYVHSQLRQRTGAMLEVLERASFAPQEQKTRKTSSGRTFVEQAAAGTA